LPTGTTTLPTGTTTCTGSAVASAASALVNTGTGLLFSVTGLRTDPQFQVTLNALNEDKNTRILSEPQILALNNKESFINVTTQFSYVPSYTIVYTQNQISTQYGLQTLNVPSGLQPTGYQTMDLGFKLYVTPSVGRDLRTINLHIKPMIDELGAGQTVSQFTSIPTLTYTAAGAPILPVVPLPVVDQRYLETDVVLEDNGFVILGGLIRHQTEVQEKRFPMLHRIPGLGALFKSTSKTKTTSNLVIIVEAQIVTQRGRTYRTAGSPDDGDVREGSSNRPPGQVSSLTPSGAEQLRGPQVPSLPRPELAPLALPPLPPKAPPPGRPIWRVSEEER
jgi:general secretion pathway protein D